MEGWNFDEKYFQIAIGYELGKSKIDYIREIILEGFLQKCSGKAGGSDFF